jgi:APA family basic amino acid/polyamine antiporter
MIVDDPPDKARTQLPRVLGATEAFSVIVGSVIGSGIFLVPARVADNIPAIGPIILAWVLGGLFSLAGALTVAELGAMLPHAGGPYVYLKEAFGRLPAFLFGWTEFLVIRAGSVATLAAAFALYTAQLVPAPGGMRHEWWQMVLASAAMLAVAVVNAMGTRLGGGVQVLGTALKVGALTLMILGPFVLGKARAGNLSPVAPADWNAAFTNGFMVAMVSILWAYDGWINASALAEEIRDPGRNIPRAMILGMTVVMAIYLAMTLVYHLVLPMADIRAAATAERGTPRVVAAVFCQTLIGPAGFVAICLAVMASTLFSLNGNALSGPRAYFAMARDGLFPRGLCTIHPVYRTPANAIFAQAIWAIVLTVASTLLLVTPPPSGGTLPAPIERAWKTLHSTPLYDVMYTYVIFGGTVIYTLTIAAVFVLRKRHPDWPRPYRAWGYPVTPIVYMAAAGLLMVSMLRNTPFESVGGLGIILLGVPAYRLFATRSAPDAGPAA